MSGASTQTPTLLPAKSWQHFVAGGLVAFTLSFVVQHMLTIVFVPLTDSEECVVPL